MENVYLLGRSNNDKGLTVCLFACCDRQEVREIVEGGVPRFLCLLVVTGRKGGEGNSRGVPRPPLPSHRPPSPAKSIAAAAVRLPPTDSTNTKPGSRVSRPI